MPWWDFGISELRFDVQSLLRDIATLRQEIKAMASAVQQAINDLKAEIEPMKSAVDAMGAAFDTFIEQVEEAKDDPEEIAAVTAGFRAEKDRIVALSLKGTAAEEPPVE